ncbi:hypothetical protein BUALT_Bualt15G0118700 [Buddleja alternifolia]|uniref:Calmodulin-binding protein n=1 Tax=Buddleja alternifolia TaxID=168488 RepID=A0AAV6WJR5_9LAMI|nr:hypothetical protein BUALT_Bualt15G0118700 [Buddleja alternifolia]
MEQLENPATAKEYSDGVDSCCSTPYVSAPSSPGRDNTPVSGFYYSAPTSPMHFVLASTTNPKPYPSSATAAVASDGNGLFDFDFDFSATLPSTRASSPESMTSADELFFNGQIRPMKLSTHLLRPQLLAPLIESDDDIVEQQDQTFARGRDSKFRAGSVRRRTRSMSPMRTTATPFQDEALTTTTRSSTTTNSNYEEQQDKEGSNETTPSASRSSSKRWVFLKEFLYRSKSEGRNNEGHNKFWGFSPVKDKKTASSTTSNAKGVKEQNGGESKRRAVNSNSKNGVGNGNGKGKRRVPSVSAHELHYTAKRAEAEEMRRKTYLPYRHGLFGCLGFSSKSYGAINGFARAFNTLSSST